MAKTKQIWHSDPVPPADETLERISAHAKAIQAAVVAAESAASSAKELAAVGESIASKTEARLNVAITALSAQVESLTKITAKLDDSNNSIIGWIIFSNLFFSAIILYYIYRLTH